MPALTEIGERGVNGTQRPPRNTMVTKGDPCLLAIHCVLSAFFVNFVLLQSSIIEIYHSNEPSCTSSHRHEWQQVNHFPVAATDNYIHYLHRHSKGYKLC